MDNFARATLAPDGSKCVIMYTDIGELALVDPFFKEILVGEIIAHYVNAYPGLDPKDGCHPGFHFMGVHGNPFFLHLDRPITRAEVLATSTSIAIAE